MLFGIKLTIHFRSEQKILSKLIPRTGFRKFMNHIALGHHRFVALQIWKNQRFAMGFQRSLNGIYRTRGAVVIKKIVTIGPFWAISHQGIRTIETLHGESAAFILVLLKDLILQTRHIHHFSRSEVQILLGHWHLLIGKLVAKQRQTLARHGIICQSEHEIEDKARLAQAKKSVVIGIVGCTIRTTHAKCRMSIQTIKTCSRRTGEQAHSRTVVGSRHGRHIYKTLSPHR